MKRKRRWIQSQSRYSKMFPMSNETHKAPGTPPEMQRNPKPVAFYAFCFLSSILAFILTSSYVVGAPGYAANGLPAGDTVSSGAACSAGRTVSGCRPLRFASSALRHHSATSGSPEPSAAILSCRAATSARTLSVASISASASSSIVSGLPSALIHGC